MTDSPLNLAPILEDFFPEERVSLPQSFGNGHINSTLLLTGEGGEDYILQRINKAVFTRPDWVMENMVGVLGHIAGKIRAEGGDLAHGVVQLRFTREGKAFHVDEKGDYWRCMLRVPDSQSFDDCDDPALIREIGLLFGRFLRQLDDYDSASLHETIEKFHFTPNRFAQLRQAVEEDRAGRGAGVRELIDALLSYEDYGRTLTDALAAGRLPLRVTHNDTKINNALLHRETGKGLCVIDLDTIMPGLSAYDFGDAIRTCADTCPEDEPDTEKIHVDLQVYRAYAEGYLSETACCMSPEEVDSLAQGARMMTLECAVRFLTDYLNGDVYFHIAYPEHNLVRSKSQLALLRDMDRHFEEMLEIVRELGKKYGGQRE